MLKCPWHSQTARPNGERGAQAASANTFDSIVQRQVFYIVQNGKLSYKQHGPLNPPPIQPPFHREAARLPRNREGSWGARARLPLGLWARPPEAEGGAGGAQGCSVAAAQTLMAKD